MTGLVRVDMHLHTDLSFDCLSRPAEVVRVARERGLGRIVVTDHNQIRAALEMRDRDPDLVVVGEEVKTREGYDLIGIFLTELIPKGTPARETAQRIRDQGGVVYLPHPFDVGRSGAGARAAAIADLVDVVEVHNARCLRHAYDRRAAEWADAHGKLHGAGSDAHTPAELGRGYVEVPPFEPDRESFLAALRAGGVGECVRSSALVRVASTWAKVRKVVG